MNNALYEKKKKLRQKMQLIQSELSPDYLDEASRKIQAQVLDCPEYKKADAIFVYVNTEKEPQTSHIIEQALRDEKMVYVPKCISKTKMLAVRIHTLYDLKPGMLGILEPEVYNDTRKADMLDLILVPCVSASLDGCRLGHGAGYYDRFLEGYEGNMFCLCFKEMLSDQIPVDDLDIMMQKIITD